jgi:hypothetical protein
MITIKLQTDIQNVEALLQLIKDSNLASNIDVEDLDDQNLKPMTATDFYKRINASNLAQLEKRVFSQKTVEEEVKQW